MCLAVPGKIVKIEKGVATVDYGCEKRDAAVMNGSFKAGDYVIVTGKVVVQKVPEREAKRALRFYRQL